MYLTGFADEADQSIDLQIKATKELGWNAIESRNISGTNIHDISDAEFDIVYGKLEAAGVRINCFGSAIGNWAKNILDPFEITLAEVERAIPRMQRLGTKLVRIMSYARSEGEEQHKEERFRRLREIVARFEAAGIMPVHENCMNYGGMSAEHTLELVENVPGLRLVFDTGNGPFNKDFSAADGRWQNSWDFYSKVKQHVAYIHIKDTLSPEGEEKETYTMPGEGQGDVRGILEDLKSCGYDGGISIEPHLAAVFHDPSAVNSASDKSYELYLEYGRRLMALLGEIGYEYKKY